MVMVTDINYRGTGIWIIVEKKLTDASQLRTGSKDALATAGYDRTGA